MTTYFGAAFSSEFSSFAGHKQNLGLLSGRHRQHSHGICRVRLNAGLFKLESLLCY